MLISWKKIVNDQRPKKLAIADRLHVCCREYCLILRESHVIGESGAIIKQPF